jgi:hypothetical protein
LKHEDTDAGAFIIDRKTRPLHEVLTHEFAHSLDNTKTNDLFKASARLLALTRDTEELYDYGLFWYIGKLRIEGPATFFQTRSHKFIVYDSSFVNSARMAITQYNGVKGISMETPYLSGSYMCYTIGLAYMKERRRDEFDSMIARIGSTELTFRNGMDRIIPLKGKVELQNLPVEVIDMVFAKVKELSHLGFLKEYENACRIVDIPPEQIIITFSEYSRLKRIAYDYWKTLMQEKGFE